MSRLGLREWNVSKSATNKLGKIFTPKYSCRFRGQQHKLSIQWPFYPTLCNHLTYPPGHIQ